jgi:hypothetical protein
MDFLKKHYDKILLAMAFVLVIISGVILVLKVNSLSQRLNRPDAILTPSKKADYVPLDTRKYVEALDAVQHPSVWASSPVDLFRAGIDTGRVNSNKPIAFLRFERLPFDLLFKAYSWNAAEKKAFNFQISLLSLQRAYFVPAVGDEVKDQFGDTGYRLTKFERKVESVFNPSVGVAVEVDHSEVTLERPGEDAILLERDKGHLRTESVATIVCQEDPQKEIQVRRNQSITCPSNTYIVIDMNDKQMVIKNSITGKEDIIERFQGITGAGGAVPGAVPPPVAAPAPFGGAAPVVEQPEPGYYQRRPRVRSSAMRSSSSRSD